MFCSGLVANLGLTLVTPWTTGRQAPPSVGFSRQEQWSGLPLPFPVGLPNPQIKPRSPALKASLLDCQQILRRLSSKGSHPIVYNTV